MVNVICGKFVYIPLGILLLFMIYGEAIAHIPHDHIQAVAVSHSINVNKGIFIIVGGGIKKSVDGGYSWKRLCNGLDNSYRLSSISISPTFDTDGFIFVSSLGDGIFKSSDGGNSWSRLNIGLKSLDISTVVMSPDYAGSENVIAADTKGGLFKTSNGGHSWEPVFESSGKITGVSFLPSAQGYKILLGDEEGSVYILSDGGEKWEVLAQFEGSGSITDILVSPYFLSDRTIWIGTSKGGIFKSANRGESFYAVNSGLLDKNVTSLASSVDNQKKDLKLYASTWTEGFYISGDGGQSWQKFAKGLTTDPQADDPDFNAPHFKGIGVGGSGLFHDRGPLFLGGFDGLFRSDDGGLTWYQLETLPLKYVCALSLSPISEKGGSYSAITTYGGGAYIYDDVKKKWTVNKRSLSIRPKNSGRSWSNISDIVFSPAYEIDGAIISAGDHEALMSKDRGITWQRVNIKPDMMTRARKRINRYLRRFGVSGVLRQKMVGSFYLMPGWPSYIAVSPAYYQDKKVYLGASVNGIYCSEDGGRTFRMLWDAKGKMVTSLEISPSFVSDNTLFAGLAKNGIYKTEDGGNSWELLKQISVPGWIHIVISPDYKNDKTVFAGTPSGLFCTINGGESWELLRVPAFGNFNKVIGLGISPCYERDGMLLVSLGGRGLFQTRDKGEAFSEVASELIDDNCQLRIIRFSPKYCDDSTIYGASADEIFQSGDGGQTWKMLNRPIRYEDVTDVMKFEGKWETVRNDGYSDSTSTRSKTSGNKLKFRFIGSGIEWIGEKSPDNGRARIYLDSKLISTVSQYDEAVTFQDKLFKMNNLSKDLHEITIEVVEPVGPSCPGWISIDALEILP